MFVIQVQNALGETSKHYWMNQSGDDFLRYLPRNFGVPKENIRAWMFSDDEFPILEGLLKALGDKGAIDLSEEGKIKALRVNRTETPAEVEGEPPVVTESTEVLAEYLGQEIGWPYSSEWTLSNPEAGKFMGHHPK
jgi:hypothetical protein